MASRGASTPGRRALIAASYLELWALTLAGLLAGRIGVRLSTIRPPRDALTAQPHTVLLLLAHNAPIALWPLALIALDWPRIPVARHVGDALIAGQLAGHGLFVGVAIAQQPTLWRYLPHLPLEWLALALPAAAWSAARRGTPVRREDAARIALVAVAVLAAAALVETYLVPIP